MAGRSRSRRSSPRSMPSPSIARVSPGACCSSARRRRFPRSGPARVWNPPRRSPKLWCHRRLNMALFRTVDDTLPSIAGHGVTLRVPQSNDFSEWADLRELSRAFLTPWEPTWPADDLTRGAFRRRLKRYNEDLRADLAYAFLIFRNDDNALVGGLTLANIRRGVAQAGSIGYWVGAPFARQGYMTAAMRALVPFCFGTLPLHRLEAKCAKTE